MSLPLFLTLKTTLKTKINIHKGTRVIKLHFTLADDAMFYIIWFMRCFSFLFQRTVVECKMYKSVYRVFLLCHLLLLPMQSAQNYE